MGPRPVRLVLALVAAAAFAVAAASTPGGRAAADATPSDRQIISTVCSTVPHKLLRRIQLGARTDRSGQIQILPKEPNYVDGGLPHAGPWDYVQDVPLMLYGPGVKPGVYSRPVTLADIAPTEGSMLKFDGFHAPDGTPLVEGLQPASQRTPPKLLVVLIWDSGGTDVLDRWPHDWPYLKSMAKHGAWFTHATAGASPSNTPVSHATIGTGAFPDKHGFTDEYVEVNDQIQKPNANGPSFLIEPTFADIYDHDMGNKPIVGGIATLSAHIMMMSHGSEWGGGDRDIAVTREQEHGATAGAESVSWDLTHDMAPFYRLPGYANKVGNLAADARDLDRRDGKLDGMWRQNSIAQYGNGFDTPARTPYQTSLIKAAIAREGFGKDEVPDLLYLNYKAIDSIGHIWSADGIEMSDTLKIQDENLKVLVDYLNQVVGKNQWNMILTADHGTNRDPSVTGAWRIGIDELTADITNTFDNDHDGVPLIMKLRPTEVWLDMNELKQNGYTVEQVSNYIANLTEQQTIKGNVETPKPGQENDKVFSGAWPTVLMSQMPCLPHGQDQP
jgi:Type I phosphodiesterase / nucleotide pyrophosphatase